MNNDLISRLNVKRCKFCNTRVFTHLLPKKHVKAKHLYIILHFYTLLTTKWLKQGEKMETINFMEAIKLMEEGQIFTNESDMKYRIKNHELQFFNNDIWQISKTILKTHCESNWKIVKEPKKTLSDEIHYGLYSSNRDAIILIGSPTSELVEQYCEDGFIQIENVYKFINKLKKEMHLSLETCNKIDKLAGEKLV